MRILSVVAVDIKTKEKRTFTFGGSEGTIVTSKGGKLNGYLEYCFDPESVSGKDVEVKFAVFGEEYSLRKYHSEDGAVKHTLKKSVDGKWQVVAHANAVAYVEKLVGEKPAEIIKASYVNNAAAENYDGGVEAFRQLRTLKSVEQSAAASLADARARTERVMAAMRQAAATTPAVTGKQIEEINAKLDEASRKVAAISAELGRLGAPSATSKFRNEVAAELSLAQQQYNLLAERKDEVEKQRAEIKLHDEISELVPLARSLKSLQQQRDDYEQKRYAVVSELEWQENELANVNQQLEEKHRSFALVTEKRNKIENIGKELSYVSSLYERNKVFNEKLAELNEQLQRYTAQRVVCQNKLDSVEKAIEEVRGDLDGFDVPTKSVGELMESVRLDVKIDEVTAQIEKLQSEIAVKESQAAEKESNLVVLVKRFKSIAELDVAVSPIKAKDTILQVLDAKYSKLETVNASLNEKLRNFRRALEDYRHRLLEIDASNGVLEENLENARYRKQEEFKREVYLNSQRTSDGDISAVFAVTADFNDKELVALQQEMYKRNMDRSAIADCVARLEGAIEEIKRHIEINSAEMETLSKEKSNILNRYNEILAQNKNETVFHYLKALESDSGTKYLLDVQQDAVRAEAELAELKKNSEAQKTKLGALKQRLRYLQDTRQQLDGQATMDVIVSTNDKLKDELSDIGGRLSANYEQYKAVYKQLEAVDEKLDAIRSAITEVSKTVKVNERQIAAANKRAQQEAGTEDLEQAVASFKYEVGDVESELQMLEETKRTVEKEVFRKRLELEKLQWLFESKQQEYKYVYDKLQFELNLKGVDMEKIDEIADDAEARKAIAEYDEAKAALTGKIENYYALLKDRPDSDEARDTAAKEQELQQALQEQKQLEEERGRLLEEYATANSAKVRIAAVAAEAETLSALKKTIGHNEIVSLLVRDKINSMLQAVAKSYNALTGENCAVECEEGKIVVKNGQTKIEYAQLDAKQKTALFVALTVAFPNVDASDGRWLVFEERINADRDALSSVLKNAQNVNYVTEIS